LGGDFNFLEEGELRSYTDGREPTGERVAMLRKFVNAFGHFIEIAQMEPTYRTMGGEDGVMSLGRLDRFYLSAATADLLDAAPRSGVIGLAHDPAQPSDHVPVWLQFSPGGRTTPTIPTWIAKRPDFKAEVENAVNTVEMPRDPFEKLKAFKDAMFVAKDEILNRMFSSGPGPTRRSFRFTSNLFGLFVEGMLGVFTSVFVPYLSSALLLISIAAVFETRPLFTARWRRPSTQPCSES